MKTVLVISVILLLCQECFGHGYLEDPINRASMWRFQNLYPDAESNYNDMEYFCGGFTNQTNLYGGKCGMCGDSYGDKIPRSNENTGLFGRGISTKTYKSGAVIDIGVQLTANHLGQFSYQLCKLNSKDSLEVDECFKPLKMADGSNYYAVVASDNTLVKNAIKLPDGLTCEHCVLRWHYHCGNSYGLCDTGDIELGCGPQETFRSCSDITIV